MHARVTTISGSPEQAEQGIANFRDNVVPTIKEMGGHGGVLLIDRASGKAMAITLWEDEAAMRASEESRERTTTSGIRRAGRSRAAARRAVRGSRLREVVSRAKYTAKIPELVGSLRIEERELEAGGLKLVC